MIDRPPDPAEAEAETPQGGVFGNLPDSRPGGRSPRRDAAARPGKTSAKTATPKAPRAKPKAAAAKPKPTAKPRSKPAPTPPASPADEADERGGLEDIAWAGVAAAAEAATVGVRLLSKTIEALRGNSERR
jgi:hypothetical protein